MSADSVKQGLRLMPEMDALGISPTTLIMREAESMGNVTAVELLVFRDAISRRVREQTTEAEEEKFEPAPNLPEEVQDRLRQAHMIGSTVADILLSDNAIKHRGVSA